MFKVRKLEQLDLSLTILGDGLDVLQVIIFYNQ